MQSATLLQVEVLLLVMENEGITQPELSKRLNTTQATITRTIQKLAHSVYQNPNTNRQEQFGLGLLEASEWAEDSRIRAVFLTEKGKRLRDKIKQLG
jgi:DNA-binding MarR family transcriptional regulator